MRIIGELPHSSYKITVLEMNKRVSVKIEDRLLEQTYKFREGAGVATVADVQALLTDEFMSGVAASFTSMYDSYVLGLEAMAKDDDLSFEII